MLASTEKASQSSVPGGRSGGGEGKGGWGLGLKSPRALQLIQLLPSYSSTWLAAESKQGTLRIVCTVSTPSCASPLSPTRPTPPPTPHAPQPLLREQAAVGDCRRDPPRPLGLCRQRLQVGVQEGLAANERKLGHAGSGEQVGDLQRCACVGGVGRGRWRP